MKTIVVCDDVEIERLLLKEILCQYFEEINEEVSIVEYDSIVNQYFLPMIKQKIENPKEELKKN